MIKRKVRIKTWEEMDKEFGLDEDGDIKCPIRFIKEMEERLPKDRIIELELEDFWWLGYTISSYMIEEVLPLEITLEELEEHFGCKIKII